MSLTRLYTASALSWVSNRLNPGELSSATVSQYTVISPWSYRACAVTDEHCGGPLAVEFTGSSQIIS